MEVFCSICNTKSGKYKPTSAIKAHYKWPKDCSNKICSSCRNSFYSINHVSFHANELTVEQKEQFEHRKRLRSESALNREVGSIN